MSVLVPVHDGEAFVGEAIESCLRQSFPDFELVVVDDGSTDATPDIVSRYAERDRRIVVHRQENRGYVAALGVAAALAKGELLARLDADDLAEPGRLARQVAFLDEHPEVAVVGGALLVVDRRGRPFYLAAYPLEPAEVSAAMSQRTPVGHPTATIRRHVFDAVGGYRADFPYAEDYDLWLRVAREHRIANLPDILGRYRVHGANASYRKLPEQARSMVAARAAAAGEEPNRSDQVAETTLELALWWGMLLTRAGEDAGARAAWRLARDAAGRTREPASSRRRIAALRAKLDAERGRRIRARVHGRRS